MIYAFGALMLVTLGIVSLALAVTFKANYWYVLGGFEMGIGAMWMLIAMVKGT